MEAEAEADILAAHRMMLQKLWNTNTNVLLLIEALRKQESHNAAEFLTHKLCPIIYARDLRLGARNSGNKKRDKNVLSGHILMSQKQTRELCRWIQWFHKLTEVTVDADLEYSL